MQLPLCPPAYYILKLIYGSLILMLKMRSSEEGYLISLKNIGLTSIAW